MCAIYGNIYHQYTPNVSINLPYDWIRHGIWQSDPSSPGPGRGPDMSRSSKAQTKAAPADWPFPRAARSGWPGDCRLGRAARHRDPKTVVMSVSCNVPVNPERKSRSGRRRCKSIFTNSVSVEKSTSNRKIWEPSRSSRGSCIPLGNPLCNPLWNHCVTTV